MVWAKSRERIAKTELNVLPYEADNAFVARRLKVAAALSVLAYLAGVAAFWGHRPSLASPSGDPEDARGSREPGGIPASGGGGAISRLPGA